MRQQIDEDRAKEEAKQAEVNKMKSEFERLKEINMQHYAEAAGFQSIFEKYEGLKSRKTMLEDNRKHLFDGMTEMKGSYSPMLLKTRTNGRASNKVAEF
jgi:DNA repair protein RAD50